MSHTATPRGLETKQGGARLLLAPALADSGAMKAVTPCGEKYGQHGNSSEGSSLSPPATRAPSSDHARPDTLRPGSMRTPGRRCSSARTVRSSSARDAIRLATPASPTGGGGKAYVRPSCTCRPAAHCAHGEAGARECRALLWTSAASGLCGGQASGDSGTHLNTQCQSKHAVSLILAAL